MEGLYYALLSGLHPTLPLAELRGILEAEACQYRVVEKLDQLAIYTANSPHCGRAAWRAGLVHETGKVLAVAPAKLQDLLEEASLLDLCTLLPEGSRVRVEFTRVKGYAKEHLPDNTGRRLAEKLEPQARKCRVTLTPHRPTHTLHVIASQGTAIIGLVLERQDKKLLESHRPQRRPFFHPGSLDPRLARLFVNLARAAPPGPYLDPFCGTGGFPLEAQTLGIPSICGELVERLAHGARVNLQAYPGNQNTLAVVQWDAAKLPLRDNSIQSIGTDPPYGRSVSTHGRDIHQLHQQFLNEAARILKPRAHLAMAAPHWTEEKLEEQAETAGLKILEKHYMRVHGSLTRIILITKKEL